MLPIIYLIQIKYFYDGIFRDIIEIITLSKGYIMRHSLTLSFIIPSLFLFLLLSCKTGGSGLNVTNGVDADDDEYLQSISLLKYTNKNGTYGICSSTIISHNIVLTAANCVLPKKDKLILKYSTFNNQGVREDHEVSPLYHVIHPKYDYSDVSTYKYDLAVLVFKRATFTGVSSIAISNIRPPVGTKVALVGFGCYTTAGMMFNEKTKDPKSKQPIFQKIDILMCNPNSNESTSLYKRFGENEIASSDFCPNAMIQVNQKKNIVDSQIDIPSGEDASPSSGDSGGPLLRKGGYIVGVSSYVDKVLKENRASCYVDVSIPENYQFLQDALQSVSKSQSESLKVEPPVTFEDVK